MSRQQHTLIERLTTARSEKRRLERRKERGEPFTIHHERALELTIRRINQYERDLKNLPFTGFRRVYFRKGTNM